MVFFLDILMLNIEPLLSEDDFIVISHIQYCSFQEDLEKLSIYIYKSTSNFEPLVGAKNFTGATV